MRRRTIVMTATVIVVIVVIAILAGCTSPPIQAPVVLEPSLRVGVITDMHLRPEIPKRDEYLNEFVSRMNAWSPDFVIELGDAVQWGQDTLLNRFETIYDELIPPRYYVLGNHELWDEPHDLLIDSDNSDDVTPQWGATRELYLAHTSAIGCYYSFDCGDFHFIVLDNAGDDMTGGQKPKCGETQLDWLRRDLASSHKKTFVFAHWGLDPRHLGDSTTVGAAHDADEARTIFEQDGDVAAVFMGHRHVNYYSDINGIDYYTLDNAFVEDVGSLSCTYSQLYIYPDGSIWLHGFGNQWDIGISPEVREGEDESQ